MSGTIYNLKTIAAHTGLSQNYLKKGDSSLKQVIATFPEISPDGIGLNDTGLMVFDEYIRCCSNKNGKPLMKFEEWKQLMIQEYGVKSMEKKKEETQLTVVENNSLAKLANVEVMPVSDFFGNVDNGLEQLDNSLEQVGSALATKVRHSIKTKITNKIAQEVNDEFNEIRALIKKIGE